MVADVAICGKAVTRCVEASKRKRQSFDPDDHALTCPRIPSVSKSIVL